MWIWILLRITLVTLVLHGAILVVLRMSSHGVATPRWLPQDLSKYSHASFMEVSGPIDSGGFRGFGRMSATAPDEGVCQNFDYHPSRVEADFQEHAMEYNQYFPTVCKKMDGWRLWLDANNRPRTPVPEAFSRLCRPGRRPELLEPLVGVLRSPRYLCAQMSWSGDHVFDTDWLVLGDNSLLRKGRGRARFYDAGASFFLGRVDETFDSLRDPRGSF
mmetsp:Transcript_34371/g.106710  ORF Transcript_34371/g.106710 Transcript_34371/m.106710 type:complete len:217 (+) Transcript_34371:54-704(+)